MTSEQAQAARKALDQFDRIEKQIKLLADFLAEAEDIRKRNGDYNALEFSSYGRAEAGSVKCEFLIHSETHPDLRLFSAKVTETVASMAAVELHRLERVRDAYFLPEFAPAVANDRPF